MTKNFIQELKSYKPAQPKVLASGRGIYNMIDTCNKNGYSNENSTRVIRDIKDINTEWKILARK